MAELHDRLVLWKWRQRYFFREKIEDYFRFLTYAGEMRFPIFVCGILGKIGPFCDLYGADVDINTKNSLDNCGSNETVQKVLASIV